MIMRIASRSYWEARCALWVLCLGCVAARSLLGQPNYKRYLEYDSYGSDLPDGTFPGVQSESECQAKCSDNAKCTGYVWAYDLPASSSWYNYCWLKQVCACLQVPAGLLVVVVSVNGWHELLSLIVTGATRS
jgi:hypothetical protein